MARRDRAGTLIDNPEANFRIVMTIRNPVFSNLAEDLSVSSHTVKSWIDILEGHAMVERCRPRLEAVIESRFGDHLRDRAQPEDVLQETLLRAFRSLGRFRWQGDESFLRWLGGIAEHVILDLAGTPHWIRRDATSRYVAEDRAVGSGPQVDGPETRCSRPAPRLASRPHPGVG
jgi:sigma-70-like protein